MFFVGQFFPIWEAELPDSLPYPDHKITELDEGDHTLFMDISGGYEMKEASLALLDYFIVTSVCHFAFSARFT